MQLTGWTTLFLIAGWVVFSVYLYHLVPMLWQQLGPSRFSRTPATLPQGHDWPEVSVVMAARNESAAIRKALASLAALDYPKLRIVAVDDRSDDGTGAIMDELAAADPRFEIIHVRELPRGWLGKNHANYVAAAKIDSPWILFTDGDVFFEPDALTRTIAYAQRDGIDHLALTPALVPGGMWENAMVATFGMMFRFRFKPWLVRTRSKKHYIGIGAFNLIRRDAYDRIGTHRRLAMEVADDLKLGKLVKEHDLCQDVADGRGVFRLRWQVGLRGVVRGLTKNAFAGFDYSLAVAIAASVAFASAFLAPYVLVFLLPSPAWWGFAAALAILHLGFATMLWHDRLNIALTLLLPITLSIFLYIVWRSIIITLCRGGIVWRGTFYPLDDLRRGVV